MGCGVGTKEGAVAGCGSSGGCTSGGCSRNNVYDWLADMPLSFNENFNIVEVSFKKGARKGYYRNTSALDMHKGQLVVVEAAQGYDVGEVSLQGELVRAQMKKRRITERDDTIRTLLRIANEADINLFLDGRNKEQETMIRARAIAKTLNLVMKVGDVEYQADGTKITIYYIADGRVDFRELVRVYARDFKVKIEMRQIGARQEAARIGGVGTCGRELCCSTWLQDFKSVTTNAIRYQNLSINSDKMSGQCGRLKCCLNYELDTYNDALKKFPKHSDRIETEAGTAYLRKTEILKKQLWYEYADKPGSLFKLDVEDAAELIKLNKQGKKVAALAEYHIEEKPVIDESKHDDLVGQVSLAVLEEKSRKNKNRNQKQKGGNQTNRPNQNRDSKPAATADGTTEQSKSNTQNRPNTNNQNRPKNNQNKHKDNRNKPPQNNNPKTPPPPADPS